MSELAVDQPARDKQRDYQRGTQDKSQQVIPDACSFHFLNVGQAFLPVLFDRLQASLQPRTGRNACLTYFLKPLT